MPLMNAQGTNTAHSTNPTATIGPVTSSMALMVAVRASSPLAICRSMFSSTTMASSTTMPTVSTSPNSERLLRLKPSTYITANVPMSETGTSIMGRIMALQSCRKKSTTSPTTATAQEKRLPHVVDRIADVERRVVGDVVINVVGELGFQFLHFGSNAVGDFQGIGAGELIDAQSHGRHAVEAASEGIILRTDGHAHTSRMWTSPVADEGGPPPSTPPVKELEPTVPPALESEVVMSEDVSPLPVPPPVAILLIIDPTAAVPAVEETPPVAAPAAVFAPPTVEVMVVLTPKPAGAARSSCWRSSSC